MKTIKPMMLAVIMGLQMTAVSAQDNNPVIEQINITRDAVEVALEEFSQGKIDTQFSYDSQVKLNEFNEAASKALVKFELDVRMKVLQSLSVLVNQYNSTYANRSLGSARNQILTNLLTQIKRIAEDKSYTYREAYLDLYKVLPDLPIAVDFNDESEWGKWYKNNPLCMGVFSSCETSRVYYYDFNGQVLMTQSGSQELKFKDKMDDQSYLDSYTSMYGNEIKITYDGLYDLITRSGFITSNKARTRILQGCYTSTCYFQLLSQYTIWKSMVESNLARDIVIELVDGNSVTITNNVKRSENLVFIIDYYLTGISTEGLVNNLPYEASEERVEILQSINKELQGRGNCRTLNKLKDDLCQTTREGCLQDSEVELFKDRFNSEISCLAN
jgi:hypothetical protein